MLTARPARAQAVGAATENARFENGVLGPMFDAGVGTSAAGDDVLFELGGTAARIRSTRDGRWLLQWEALAALRGGYLGNEHPYLFLLGWHASAFAEAGFRFRARRYASPYVGLRLTEDAQILWHPGLGLKGFERLNNSDGVAGVVAHASLRADVGTSLLDARRSLLLVAFVQETLREPEAHTSVMAFGEAGIALRFDLARNVEAAFEALGGVTANRREPLLGVDDRTMHLGVALRVRKLFATGMWLGLTTSLDQDSDHLVFYASGASYDTENPPVFALTLSYGMSMLGSKR